MGQLSGVGSKRRNQSKSAYTASSWLRRRLKLQRVQLLDHYICHSGLVAWTLPTRGQNLPESWLCFLHVRRSWSLWYCSLAKATPPSNNFTKLTWFSDLTRLLQIFIPIERFELPKVTKSYETWVIDLIENRMFRVSKPFVNTLFYWVYNLWFVTFGNFW